MSFSTHRQQITLCNTPISITLNKLPPCWPQETEHLNTWRDVYVTHILFQSNDHYRDKLKWRILIYMLYLQTQKIRLLESLQNGCMQPNSDISSNIVSLYWQHFISNKGCQSLCNNNELIQIPFNATFFFFFSQAINTCMFCDYDPRPHVVWEIRKRCSSNDVDGSRHKPP